MDFDKIILNQLFTNEKYARKVLPHIREDFFFNEKDKEAVKIFKNYFLKYNKIPSFKTIIMEYNLKNQNEDKQKEFLKNIRKIKKIEINEPLDWLMEKTEKHFKQVALETAILKSVDILKSNKEEKGVILSLVEEALQISFDNKLGLDYFNEIEERWEKINRKIIKIPFLVGKLNEATNGGVEKKTINIISGGTNVGKCSLGNTKIKIKNKKTNEIFEITLEELYLKFKKYK